MNWLRLLRQFAILSIFSGVWADAAVPKGPLVVTPGKVSVAIHQGTVVGGKARDEFSLIAVRLEPAGQAGGERVSLMYGDRFGKPLNGEPGFFHVTVDRNSRRVVIDLAQMQMTAVGPERLAKTLATSKLVASSEMTMDPIDGSTNITLQTKVPVTVKVGSIEGDSSRVYIEMMPASGERK